MSELLYGSPTCKPISSSEILEWAAELKLRNEAEKAAYEESRSPDDGLADVAGNESMPPEVDAEILRVARQRGYID